MFDPFENAGDSLIAPAKTAFAITPDDNADLPSATKAVYVGGDGDLILRAVDDVGMPARLDECEAGVCHVRNPP